MSSEDRAPTSSIDLSTSPEAVLSANSALRLLLGLLALWTLLSGLALVFFQDASGATIGGGFSGNEGTAAQRLLGVHMLVLAPLYGLLAWEPKRFRLLLWVPYAALGLTLAVTLFDILTGDRDFQDGVLPFVVNLVFFALFIYVWRASRAVEGVVQHADALAAPIETPPPGDSEEHQA